MELLEMTNTGDVPAASGKNVATTVESIVQLVVVASGNDEPSDFENTLRSLLLPLDENVLKSIRSKISKYRTDDLRVFGHVVYALSHRSEDNLHQLPSNDIAIPFYAESTPTAVTFGSNSVGSRSSILSTTLSMEYSLLLHEVDPSTALTLGRAAVLCRSISGGLPLAVGGVFKEKFVSPYSGTMTFSDLMWIGSMEKRLAPHADYLREHRTYERHFIEDLLAKNP